MTRVVKDTLLALGFAQGNDGELRAPLTAPSSSCLSMAATFIV
jgi:hypothetical protein